MKPQLATHNRPRGAGGARSKCLARVALVLSLGLAACEEGDAGLAPREWEFPTWVSKSDELGSGLTTTRDPALLVFDGYNHVSDTRVSRNCVLPEAGELDFASFRAGSDQFETKFTYIESREELEQALGIDAAASVKIGPLGGGGSLGIASEYKSSDKSLAILLRTRQMYTVVNQDRHHLTEEALGVLRAEPTRFVRECGTGYIAGVAYGAELSLLVQIEASTLEESKEVKAKLEAEGIRAGPVSIDASLGTAFTRALGDENVEVSVSVEARGFVPSADINSLGALDERAFMAAAEAQRELQASVSNDKCNDQGDAGGGTCGDRAASGYLANGFRAAVPMGVLHQPFQRAANFPGDSEVVDGLLSVDRDALTAVRTIREYAEIYRAMVGIHNDEVGGMLNSDTPYEFNVYDASDELQWTSYEDLLAYAQFWAAAYEPQEGAEVRALAHAISDCWTRLQFSDFSECQTSLRVTDAGREILQTMDEYAEQRVRPLYFVADPDALTHSAAETACPAGWRQPNAAEASRLWFAVERDPGMPECKNADSLLEGDRAVWHDSAECTRDESGWIERAPDGTFRTGCHADRYFAYNPRLLSLCVPASGVFGASIPELPSAD